MLRSDVVGPLHRVDHAQHRGFHDIYIKTGRGPGNR